MPGWDFAHEQNDVNPHVLRMLEDIFAWRGPHNKISYGVY